LSWCCSIYFSSNNSEPLSFNKRLYIMIIIITLIIMAIIIIIIMVIWYK
jgi:magnesium-transporting ATPase (P-type)